MTDLRIVYDVEGWAFSHAARALVRHAPPDFRVSIAALTDPAGRSSPDAALGENEPTVMFAMHTRPEKPALLQARMEARGWRCAVAGAWNAGWPLHAELFEERYAQVDALLLNNEIAWEWLGGRPRTHLCPNGVDLDVFQPTVAPAARPPRVLWCGGLHWRQVKGYDDILLPLEERLRARGFACDFRQVNSRTGVEAGPAEMAAWYNTGSVYVCASTSEGTPNTALEAAACGCAIVSTPVGNMPELIRPGHNGYLVERTVAAFEAAILEAHQQREELAARMAPHIARWDWRFRVPAFFDAFRSAIAVRQNRK